MFVSLLPFQTCLDIVVGGEAQGWFWLFHQEKAWEPLSTAESYPLLAILLSSKSHFFAYIGFIFCMLGIWIVFCERRFVDLNSLWSGTVSSGQDLNLDFPLQISALGIRLDR